MSLIKEETEEHVCTALGLFPENTLLGGDYLFILSSPKDVGGPLLLSGALVCPDRYAGHSRSGEGLFGDVLFWEN